MAIRRATLADVDRLVELERQFFRKPDERPEPSEGYRFILAHGEAYLREDKPGMLAVLPVNAALAYRADVLALPPDSPLRERVRRGYLDSFPGYGFIHAFLSAGRSEELTALFREQDPAVGFVPAGHERSLDFYLGEGCAIVGDVENVHYPGKRDLVLTRGGLVKETHPSRET